MSIKYIAKFVVLAFLGAMTNLAHAQVGVDAPWTRATVAGQTAGGLFMTLRSLAPVRLVGATAEIAESVEIHTMSMDGDVMRMRQIDALVVTPDQPVVLAPGGYHIMLMGLKRPIDEGEELPVSLLFEDEAGTRSTLKILAPARALGAKPPPGHGHAH